MLNALLRPAARVLASALQARVKVGSAFAQIRYRAPDLFFAFPDIRIYLLLMSKIKSNGSVYLVSVRLEPC